MLDSRETRIGNLVYENGDDGKILSSVSCWDFEKARLNNNEDIFDWFEPIPISEDWLIRFGFVKYGTLHDSYRLNPFIVELGILGNHYTFRKIMNKEESILLKEIKYVHELQNLFFELKGKELELKS